MQRFHSFDHGGDLGLEIYGDDLKELFEQAGKAFTGIVTDLSTVCVSAATELQVHAPDLEQMLVEWLTELIYRFEAHGELFREYCIRSLDNHRLLGTARGEVYDPERHPLRTTVKGATYHQLELRRYKQGWRARVIFDL